MTIFLVFGFLAGLYLLRLLFDLAIYALPVGVGIEAGFLLRACHLGIPAMLVGGFLAGVIVLHFGRAVMKGTLPAPTRAIIALVFILPAFAAGYQLAKLLLSALLAGTLLVLAGTVAGLLVANTAWQRMVTPRPDGSAAFRNG